MITSGQIRAARSLVRWSQQDLANASNVGVATIRRIEAGPEEVQAHASTVRQLTQALEEAGVVFLDADDHTGPGLRLRKGPAIG